jgi:hypothetical protein
METVIKQCLIYNVTLKYNISKNICVCVFVLLGFSFSFPSNDCISVGARLISSVYGPLRPVTGIGLPFFYLTVVHIEMSQNNVNVCIFL